MITQLEDLLKAVKANDANMVKKIIGSIELKKLTLNNLKFRVIDSPIHVAAMKGYTEIVELLLNKNSAFVNLTYPKQLLEEQNLDKYSPLDIAIEYNKVEVIGLLLNRGADPAQSKHTLPLMVQFNNMELAEILITKYPTLVDAVDKNGQTFLYYAAKHGNKKLAEMLITKYPALIKTAVNDGKTILHYAVKEGNTELAEMLITKYPTLVDVVDNDGKTVLHYAVKEGNTELAKMLITKYSILVDVVDNDGKTVLHHAAEDGRDGIITLLLRTNPELIDKIDKINQTAFYLSAYNGHVKIAKLLLELKPELIDKIDDILTLWHHVIDCGYDYIAELLLQIKPELADKKTLKLAIKSSQHEYEPPIEIGDFRNIIKLVQDKLSCEESLGVFSLQKEKLSDEESSNNKKELEKLIEKLSEDYLQILTSYLIPNKQSIPTIPELVQEYVAQEFINYNNDIKDAESRINVVSSDSDEGVNNDGEESAAGKRKRFGFDDSNERDDSEEESATENISLAKRKKIDSNNNITYSSNSPTIHFQPDDIIEEGMSSITGIDNSQPLDLYVSGEVDNA